MLRHGDIWQAIDLLAAKYGMSPSGLARRAGLDPTTFNKSKRVAKGGKRRWPGTESIAKVLEATGASLAEFAGYADGGVSPALPQRIPVIGTAQAGGPGNFDEAGFPAGGGWDEIAFPRISDPHAFALEVSGDGMEPMYRNGDIVVVSPEASLRRGDRVAIKTRGGEIVAKLFYSRNLQRVELASLESADQDRALACDAIEWIARIVWASQ